MDTLAVALLLRSDLTVADLSAVFFRKFEGSIAASNGVIRVRIYRECHSELRIACAQSVVVDLERALSVHVEGVDFDLVNTSDIATRIGKTRQYARQMIARHVAEFPRPIGIAARSRIWDWGSVNAWLERRYGIGDQEQPLTWQEGINVEYWLASRRQAASWTLLPTTNNIHPTFAPIEPEFRTGGLQLLVTPAGAA